MKCFTGINGPITLIETSDELIEFALYDAPPCRSAFELDQLWVTRVNDSSTTSDSVKRNGEVDNPH